MAQPYARFTERWKAVGCPKVAVAEVMPGTADGLCAGGVISHIAVADQLASRNPKTGNGEFNWTYNANRQFARPAIRLGASFRYADYRSGTTKKSLGRSLKSGYNIARMRFEILLAPEAVQDLRNLKAHDRAEIRDAIEVHLRHQPTKTSRSRIKRLRGISRPQFRLRVGETRIFYDVTNEVVEILVIVSKSEAAEWLKKAGIKS
jgi:mRNA interferase RelE/StbE